MGLIDKIKAEVEKKTHGEQGYSSGDAECGYRACARDILSFLDTLKVEELWKPADGDDLPKIDKEVVVFTQDFPNDAGIMKVAIAHRPNPDGWDGRNILTGEVDHYTPKTYDKGGWNIPDVRWWLDLDLLTWRNKLWK